MTGSDHSTTPGPDLVAVVATVKGPPEQVTQFVRTNLCAGADHLVVLVDDADPAVLRALQDDPDTRHRVTAIGADDAYWKGSDFGSSQIARRGRPDSLNVRQTIGANLANALVSSVPRFSWLFHLDLDERLHLDKDRLLALDPSVRAVALDVLEAVSTERPESSRRYKRRPSRVELEDLHRRGLIKRPSPYAYFRGHYSGKRGIRPDPRVRLGIHRVKEPGGEVEIEPLHMDWLQLLHDESYSMEEFVRKWRALGSAGGFGQKPRRRRLGRRVARILENSSLDSAARDDRIRELYIRHVADDADLLEELGFLVRPNPAWSAYSPQPLTQREQATLAGVANLLTGAPKRPFSRKGPPAENLLRRLHHRQARRGADPLVLAGLEAALTRASRPL